MIAATLMVKIAADTTAFNSALQQAQRATRASAQQMEQASGAVSALQNRMTTLTQGYRLGVISAERYADGLKEVRADMNQLTATSELSAKSQERLAGIGAQVTRQLNAVTTAAKRSAEGVELFGITTLAASQLATGGIASVGTAVSSLGVLARGNPWLIGIMAGLSALASAWTLIASAADRAKSAVENFTHAHREAAAGRLAAVQAAIRTTPATVTQTISGSTPMGPGPGTTMTVANATLAALKVEEARLLVEVNTLPVTRARDAAVTHTTEQLAHQRDIVADMLAMQRRTGATGPNVVGIMTAGRTVTPGSVDMPAVGVPKNPFEGISSKAMEFRNQTLDLANAIGSGVMTIASAAANGFKNFGDVLLGVLGGLMVTVGQSMIAFGVAGLAIRSFVHNPVAAIAAGAALGALGSSLAHSAQHTVSGGGGSGAAVSASGGGGFGSTGSGGGNTGGTFIIHGEPRDRMSLDDLANLLREMGYRDIQWQPA